MEQKFYVVRDITTTVEKNGKTQYTYTQLVKCKDCGHEIIIFKNDKRRLYNCKECNLRNHREAFTGYETDYMKVISFSHEKSKRLFYNVQCKSCGEISVIRKDGINKIKKCAKCVGNGITADPNTVIRRHWDTYVAGAKSRGYAFELDFNFFSDITSKQCYYCGSAPSITKTSKKYNKTAIGVAVNGIDRVNPDEGYNLQNCVPCCSICNRMKMTMGKEDFLSHVFKIVNHSIKSSTTIENTSEKDGSE